MKKLLFCAVTLEVGGIETALVTLLNYLAQQKENEQYKYEITLVLEKKQGLFLDVLDKNIKIIEYTPSTNKVVLIRKLVNFIKQQIFKLKYKNKYDFSCSYATYSKPASFVARTASKNSTLWVHSEYMTVFKNDVNEYKNFFKEIHAFDFRKIIFVSNNSKNIFIDTFKSSEKSDINIKEKVLLIHNLINYNKIIEMSKKEITDVKKERTYTFLSVGRLSEQEKKITRLIEASKKLKKDKIKFRVLIVGDGPSKKEYETMVKKEKMQNQILFLGKKKNPYPYFKIADSFIMTSEYEGFPVVYVESMVLGLPIITTNVSDSKEIIQNRFGVVTQKNVDSIYNAMKNAIENGIDTKEKFDYCQYNNEILEQINKLIDYR